MKDMRMGLIKDVEELLINHVSLEEFDMIMDSIIIKINKYEVIERSTEIVKVDNPNDRILKRYSACLMISGKSEKTIEQYMREMKRLGNFLEKPFNEITTYDIRFYLASFKDKGISNRTLEDMRAMISAFCTWMVEDGIIDKNPCSVIKPIKYIKEIRKPFSNVDIDKLRCACNNERERLMVELLLSTGVRISELVNLEIDDINPSTLAVHVRNGKGGKDRLTYTNELTMTYMNAYVTNYHINIGKIFRTKKGNITVAGARFIIKNIGERAGVQNVHPHRFRRTFATNLSNRGMKIQEIKELMGHSNIETTMEYIYMDDTKINSSYKRYTN